MKLQPLRPTNPHLGGKPQPSTSRLLSPSPEEPRETRADYFRDIIVDMGGNVGFIGALGGATYSLWAETGFTLDVIRNISIGGAAGALSGILMGATIAYIFAPYQSFSSKPTGEFSGH